MTHPSVCVRETYTARQACLLVGLNDAGFFSTGLLSHFSEALVWGKVWEAPWRCEGFAHKCIPVLKAVQGKVDDVGQNWSHATTTITTPFSPPTSPSPCFWCPHCFSWFVILRTGVWPVLDCWLKPSPWTSSGLFICAFFFIFFYLLSRSKLAITEWILNTEI